MIANLQNFVCGWFYFFLEIDLYMSAEKEGNYEKKNILEEEW